MNRLNSQSLRPRLDSESTRCTETYLFDFTDEVGKFVDNSDCSVEDLGYKVESIITFFLNGSSDIEAVVDVFWKNMYAGTPKDALILASNAVGQLYPGMLTQIKSQGLTHQCIIDMSVKYTEDTGRGMIECLVLVKVNGRGVGNGLSANGGLLPRLGGQD